MVCVRASAFCLVRSLDKHWQCLPLSCPHWPPTSPPPAARLSLRSNTTQTTRSTMRFHRTLFSFTLLLGAVALVNAANTPNLRKVSSGERGRQGGSKQNKSRGAGVDTDGMHAVNNTHLRLRKSSYIPPSYRPRRLPRSSRQWLPPRRTPTSWGTSTGRYVLGKRVVFALCSVSFPPLPPCAP